MSGPNWFAVFGLEIFHTDGSVWFWLSISYRLNCWFLRFFGSFAIFLGSFAIFFAVNRANGKTGIQNREVEVHRTANRNHKAAPPILTN